MNAAMFVIYPGTLRHSRSIEHCTMMVQERLSVLAAPRMVRSTFLFARLRSAGGVYLSGRLSQWGIETLH